MLRKLFVDYPEAVNETYGEHFYVAGRFGLLMILAGLGTIIHGFIPGFHTRTGSNMIRKLHGEMTRRQPRQTQPVSSAPFAMQLEYEI